MAKISSVHFIWIIAVLILVIAALLINLPNGDVVNKYISFASSISSLILAVVAIFYSIISNQDFSHSVKDISISAEKIRSETLNLSSKSEIFSQRVTNIIIELETLKPSVEKISVNLDSHMNKMISLVDTSNKISEKTNEPELQLDSSNIISENLPVDMTVGFVISLYLIFNSHKHDKYWKTSEVFSGVGTRASINGGAAALIISGFHGISGKIEGLIFKVDNLGRLDVEKVSELISNSSDVFSKKCKEEIDAYFGTEAEEKSGLADISDQADAIEP